MTHDHTRDANAMAQSSWDGRHGGGTSTRSYDQLNPCWDIRTMFERVVEHLLASAYL